MDKRFLVIMAVIIAGFIGVFVYSSSNKQEQGPVGTVSNHSKGENSKNVELLAYEDFQCPACSQFEPIVSEVVKKYEKEIKYTFRHFPIDTIHPNARAASRTAEAAGAQGKFFEMHDILFAQQQVWSSMQDPKSTFDGYAEQLNLDMAKFNTDFAAESTNSTINADKNEGNQKGVQGTPTFFLNGIKLDNGEISTVEDFSKKIDEAIASSSN